MKNCQSVTLSILGVLAVFCLVLAPAVPVLAQGSHPKPFVIHASHHDLSLPLREMAASAPVPLPGDQHIIPLHPTPPLPGSGAPAGEDAVLQREPLPLVGTINGLNFDGVFANGYAPPDTNGSVGNTQFVQMTNVEFAVYDKTNGNTLLGPTLIHTIWNGFGGTCDSGDGGDPVVLFDKAAQRWLVSQLPATYDGWCLAVSQTSDATGSYFRYSFHNPGGSLPDYPKLGVWPDAYYWSSNTFNPNFAGAQVCAFDRSTMLSGGAANAICFQNGTSVASLLPSDLDGSTAPPSGEPNFFIELLDTSHLGLFKFHVDFTNPGNSTFTGPTSILVTTYTEACGGFGSCIPQAGTNQTLDSLGDRVMFRLAYRNFGTHEALVVDHSVAAGSSVGVRWYEIRDPNGTPTVYQQGTFAPDSNYRWMGSIGMDQAGDIAVGYSASSSSIHPAIHYTGRVPSDPAGSMESEVSIIQGAGSQTGGLSRWGDYSSMSIDPIDDCTFFYTTEYVPSNGSFNWNTRIGSFKFVGCGSTAPDFYVTNSPLSQTVFPGGSTSDSVTVNPINGFTGTVGLTLSGCPSGATCSISPSSVSPPYNPSTLSVSTSSTIAPGNYTITITGTSGSLVRTASLILVVTDFSLSASPSSQIVRRGASTTYTASVTALNGFSGVVKFSVSGLPANTTGTFNPTSVTGHGNSTLTVSTTKKSPIGTFTLTITGTSGSVSHSAKVSLTIAHH